MFGSELASSLLWSKYYISVLWGEEKVLEKGFVYILFNTSHLQVRNWNHHDYITGNQVRISFLKWTVQLQNSPATNLCRNSKLRKRDKLTTLRSGSFGVVLVHNFLYIYLTLRFSFDHAMNSDKKGKTRSEWASIIQGWAILTREIHSVTRVNSLGRKIKCIIYWREIAVQLLNVKAFGTMRLWGVCRLFRTVERFTIVESIPVLFHPWSRWVL